MKEKVIVSYVTEHPIEGDAPRVMVYTDDTTSKRYKVEFYDRDLGSLLYTDYVMQNQWVSAKRQWFTNWLIKVYNGSGELIHTDIFNLEGKTVFIKFDAYAMGDNIAWIPYVEEFRKKHKCNVICSTFWNQLFVGKYPDILFVEPNIKVQNVYAQYYIGTRNELNKIYQPSLYLNNPLQKIASDILGLEYKEINPELNLYFGNRKKKKQVVISEYASLKVKEWNVPGGWQSVVDLFREKGYDVIVISKEYSYLKNVINKSGDLPIINRIIDILESEYYIGNSSGLSWLAWALGIPVILISDFTPPYHEFQNNCYRIYNTLYTRQEIRYEEVMHPVNISQVKNYIESIFSKKKYN